jgi:hypothetical protein
VDLELRKARTPLAGTLRLHALMWGQFETMRAALNGALPAKPQTGGSPPGDKVLPFSPRR